MFIKNPIEMEEINNFFIFGYRNSKGKDNTSMPRNLQYAVINKNQTDYTLAHFHGLWNRDRKTDTPERLEQSKKVKEFLDTTKGKKILCGDFNLSPETRSLEMLKEKLINLIKTNGITTTRSSFYKKPDKFADYTLVSPDIKVKGFYVPEIEVSDHLPMILDFS